VAVRRLVDRDTRPACASDMVRTSEPLVTANEWSMMRTMESFASTRRAALERLEEFVQAGAADYARTRNFVETGHGNVSRLSAALRHRLIGEEEVVSAVLAAHGFSAVEKFIQEVVWRTYWKGWLEQHPGVWADYVGLAAQPAPEVPVDAAMGVFTEELRSTGYLHNHARMWWAAWWCHQQGLSWAAGARFLFDHLLDADPASNTLGWRWVAGLQTRGKAYIARRDNLAKYWHDHPSLDGLEENVRARIPEETADRSRVEMPDYPEAPPELPGRIVLLGHADDLSLEHTPLGRIRPDGVALVDQPGKTEGDAKRSWRVRAMDDAANRWSAHYGADIARLPRWEDVKSWAERFRCETMLLMAPFVGPDADSWRPVRQFLCDKGINVIECRRAWDRRLFPAARSGFFPFWHKVRPGLLKQGS
jgi:deoxyribodipyrimidine photo-lyase